MTLKRLVLPALMALFALPSILNAETAVTDNGDINDGATWTLGAAPVVGDTQQWDTGALTLKTITQTWEGQELRVQTDGRLATGAAGPTLTFNGDLTLDGGTITVLNNIPFIIDLQGNNFTLNSGSLISGRLNNGRDIVIANASLLGNGTIFVEGGFPVMPVDRSAVIFQDTVNTTGFSGTFNVNRTANFFPPAILPADASFAVEVLGSGQLGLTKDYAVTSAVFDGLSVAPGTYTRDELLAIDFGGGVFINSNRILAAGAVGTLTVVSGTSTLLGDVDLSGTVDFLDIAPFIAVLAGGTNQAEADCDENGTVDFLDISPFIAILSGS